MTTKPSRSLFWAAAILIAGAILAASPNSSSAQGGCGWGIYPSWGYNVGMPGYYADFRAQSYYAAPWIAGYEAPWYSPGGYGCGYGGFGYGCYGYGGMGRYPWIWNRHAGFVTRGFVAASPTASIKVYKNPFYKAGEASPSDAPKTTSKPIENAQRISIRTVSNPFYVSK
jgi:hypothetical protein